MLQQFSSHTWISFHALLLRTQENTPDYTPLSCDSAARFSILLDESKILLQLHGVLGKAATRCIAVVSQQRSQEGGLAEWMSLKIKSILSQDCVRHEYVGFSREALFISIQQHWCINRVTILMKSTRLFTSNERCNGGYKRTAKTNVLHRRIGMASDDKINQKRCF